MWYRTGQLNKAHDAYENAERMLSEANFNRFMNQFGDMRWVVKNYDVAIIHHNELWSFYLMRRDRSEGFLERLSMAGGAITRARVLDLERFLGFYGDKPIDPQPC